MGVLEVLAGRSGQADQQSQQGVAYATQAWSNLMEGQVYKAAGNDLLKMMETKPDEITAQDVMGLAQKYKLNDESMQKLMHQLDQSGAMKAAQSTRRLLIAENAAKAGMIDSSKSAEFPGGLDSGTVGEMLKVQAKPAKEATWSASHRLKDGTPVFTSNTGAMKVGSVDGPDYNVQKDGKVFALNTPEVSPTSIYITNEKKKEAEEASPDALALAASQFLQTGTMPALGMGNANLRMRVLNKAAEMAKTSGVNPLQVPVFQAEFNANKQALAKMTKDTSGFEAFEKGMIKNADYAIKVSSTYKRTDYPAANKMINIFRSQTGDPSVVQLTNSIYAASLEYEKIRTAGTAITSAELSMGAQKKAEELMGAVQNHEQLKAAVGVMKVDSRNIVSSRKQQIEDLKKSLGSWSSTGTTGAADKASLKTKYGLED